MGRQRVRVGTCSVGSEGAVRALLEAHGIAATTSGGGPYASFAVDVWVDAADAEQAAALLAELHAPTPEPEPEPDVDDSLELRIQRKRETGVALLLAFCVTFGSAHAFARAGLGALVLAALEIYGISLVVHERLIGVALVAAAVALDAIGAVRRIRARLASATLPRARSL